MFSLADYAESFTHNAKKYSIIEFSESRFGLGLKLYPAQRFYLKLLAGEELDNTEKSIKIKDRLGEKVLENLTEVEYYQFLMEDKRISCSYEDLRKNLSKVSQFLFCMGRRASKSTMISAFVAYKLYELLSIRCPQDFLSVPPSSKIGIVMVGLSQSSSMKLFNTFYGLIKESLFFKKHIKFDPSKTGINFWSLKDLEMIEKGDMGLRGSHSIEVSAVPNSPGVRGSSNVFVIFDEFAHFTNSPHSTKDKPMDYFIYEALAPSVSSFVDPDGNPYGKVFIISSPNGKYNMFHKDYRNAFDSDIADSYTLAARAPTWEVNERVHPSFFKKEYNKDPTSYQQEYAADFLEGGTNWLKDLGAVYFAVEKGRKPLDDICHDLSKKYFVGLDFGLSRDGTSICVCHLEKTYIKTRDRFLKETFSYIEEDRVPQEGEILCDVFVVDYLRYFKPGLPPFIGYKVLDVDMLMDAVEYVFKKFPIHYGIFDQWSGAIINDLLKKRGLDNKIEMISHTQSINDSQYKLFSQLLHAKKIVLPDDTSLIKELLSLKVDINANGSIKVENTSEHDDRFDSIIRALYVAYGFFNQPESMVSVIKGPNFLPKKPSVVGGTNRFVGRGTTFGNTYTNGRWAR